MKDLGYGKDYKYPHDYPDHFVEEEYLPENLKGRTYYRPADLGFEREIRKRLEYWREKERKGEIGIKRDLTGSGILITIRFRLQPNMREETD